MAYLYKQSITKPNGKRIRSVKFHAICKDQQFDANRVQGLLAYIGYAHDTYHFETLATIVTMEELHRAN